MSTKAAYIKAITRTFYINEVVPHTSRVGRKVKKCIVLENGKEFYYSYNNKGLENNQVVSIAIDRLIDYLLTQNYQGEVIIYINSQFPGFDTREDKGYFFSLESKPPQILLQLKYLDKQQIDFTNEIMRSLMKDK